MSEKSALVRLEREKRKSAREADIRALLKTTVFSENMIRLAMIAGIIAYSTSEARSETNVGPVRTALAFALPGIGIPLIAADAGIKDRWALGAISAASVGYVTGQMVVGWGEMGVLPQIRESFWNTYKDLFGPLGDLLG